jgi:hypothetical protein
MAATESLTDTTRLYKRNLLAVSAIAIAVRTYPSSIDMVEILGSKGHLSLEAISAILTSALCYLLFAFMFYVTIDLSNIEPYSFHEKIKIARKAKRLVALGKLADAAVGEIMKHRISSSIECNDKTIVVTSINLLTMQDQEHTLRDRMYKARLLWLIPKDLLLANIRMVYFDKPTSMIYSYDEQYDELSRMKIDACRQESEVTLDKMARSWYRNLIIELKARQLWLAIGDILTLQKWALIHGFRKWGLDAIIPICFGLFSLSILYGYTNIDGIAPYFPQLPTPQNAQRTNTTTALQCTQLALP